MAADKASPPHTIKTDSQSSNLPSATVSTSVGLGSSMLRGRRCIPSHTIVLEHDSDVGEAVPIEQHAEQT